jgi:hypothetical protein
LTSCSLLALLSDCGPRGPQHELTQAYRVSLSLFVRYKMCQPLCAATKLRHNAWRVSARQCPMSGKPTELGLVSCPVQAGDLDSILNDPPPSPGPETGRTPTVLFKGEGEGDPKFSHFQNHSLLTASTNPPNRRPILSVRVHFLPTETPSELYHHNPRPRLAQ